MVQLGLPTIHESSGSELLMPGGDSNMSGHVSPEVHAVVRRGLAHKSAQ